MDYKELLGKSVASTTTLGFRFVGLATPFTQEEGGQTSVRDTEKFCDDALLSRPNGTGKIGSTFYGVLRMDGDGMGERFEACATLGELLSLNESTGFFFEGWINHFCKASAQEVLRDREDVPETARCAYCLFAGGDDVLIVAPWRVLPALALAINNGYARFTATGNPLHSEEFQRLPEFHLSAALVIEKQFFPLYQLDAYADDDLKDNKKLTHKAETLVRWREGDAVSFLGKTLHWESFAQAQAFGNDLFRLLTLPPANALARAFLQRLRWLAQQYESDLVASWKNAEAEQQEKLESSRGWLQGKWSWRASYALQQAIADAEPGLKDALSNIRKELLEPTNHPALITYLHLAAQWADLLTRTEEMKHA